MKYKDDFLLEEAYGRILENREGMPTSQEVYEPAAQAKEEREELNKDPEYQIVRLKEALETWQYAADVLVQALEFEGKDWEKQTAKKHAINLYRDAVNTANF